MGLLGVGYAMWSDSVVIKGTVTTGSVDITVLDLFSSTSVRKTEDGGMLVTDSPSLPLDGTPAGTAIDAFPWAEDGSADPDFDPVAYATAAADGEDAVRLYFHNLFPLELIGNESFCADFNLLYEGTIPVHIATRWEIVPQGDPPELPPWGTELMKYTHITMTDTRNGVPVDQSEWLSLQLHKGDIYNVKVCIDVPQTLDSGENSQELLSGRTHELIGKIVAYQWNEPPPEVITLP